MQLQEQQEKRDAEHSDSEEQTAKGSKKVSCLGGLAVTNLDDHPCLGRGSGEGDTQLQEQQTNQEDEHSGEGLCDDPVLELPRGPEVKEPTLSVPHPVGGYAIHDGRVGQITSIEEESGCLMVSIGADYLMQGEDSIQRWPWSARSFPAPSCFAKRRASGKCRRGKPQLVAGAEG